MGMCVLATDVLRLGDVGFKGYNRELTSSPPSARIRPRRAQPSPLAGIHLAFDTETATFLSQLTICDLGATSEHSLQGNEGGS